MFKRTINPDDLARLKREREEADRQYNDALTALDRAIQQASDLPDPPPPPDEHQIGKLNRLWNLLPADEPDFGSGWRARLKRFIWDIVAPAVHQQRDFNGALVDHVNRNAKVAREMAQVFAAALGALTAQLEALVTFESRLIRYVQQITPYVDTKDHEVAGLQRRINEDNAEMVDVLDRRSIGLAGGLDGVSDEIQKRAESTVVREKRFEGRVEELRTTVGALRQTLLTLQREMERVSAGSKSGPPKFWRGSPKAAERVTDRDGTALGESLAAHTYVGFEDLFRGAQEEIRARVNEYVPCFEGASDVLDVGCGRGEFLDLLREQGIGARGLDINQEMVTVCRSRGLDATIGDAVGYLDGLPDESLGGLFAAQVVEHLQPDYLIRFLQLAYRKLRPGSTIALETINPTCWFAFFDGYIRDITHVQPLHPDTMKYLVLASGFHAADIRYSAAYPEHAKLQPIAIPDGFKKARGSDVLTDLALSFNDAADKLNRLLFTHMDYAVIGERG